jgi:7tm Odorant receptor
MYLLPWQTVWKSSYDDIMDFVNSASFEPNNKEHLELRRSSYRRNFIAIAAVNAFCFVLVTFFMFNAALKGNFEFPQKIFVPIDFKEHFWAFVILFVLASTTLFALASLCVSSTQLLCSMISSINTEFKIVGICFERELDNLVLINPNKAEMEKNLVKFTKRHQELLK